MRDSPDVLVVMAKYPTPGTVKTRLARDIGAEAAAALCRAFLGDLARLASGPWQLVWAVTPADADLCDCVGAGQRQMPQVGDDLAPRMLNCFAELFRQGARRVVMIGADMPHLGESRIAAAFAALDDCDAVFVPTRDGGYGLIGLLSPHDLFSAIPMGNAQVFARTRARMAELGLRWREFPTSFDIDDIDDVDELRRLIAVGSVDLPRTAAILNA
jgi:rSAM/selenodomain-associated transferase 1